MTTVTLIGADGSVWELLNRNSPVQLQAGLGGLHLPKVTHHWSTAARRPGRKWRDSIADSRSFSMNLLIGDPNPPFRTGDAWRQLDGAFWNALSTDLPATLVVNGQRSLTFRLDEDNEHDFTKDPALLGKAVYPVACIADSPDWRGRTETFAFPWQENNERNYYGGTSGLGPPFIINPGDLLDIATVRNPGDLPAYPVWTITGPAAAVEVGVPGRTIRLPFILNDGDSVIIDTLAQTITDPQGTNLWPKMGFAPVDLAPIPPGDQVKIAIGLDRPLPGASISVELTAHYRRAWGSRLDIALPGIPGGASRGLGVGPLGQSPLGR